MVQQTQTTVTTRTTEQPTLHQTATTVAPTQILNKEAVITNVTEKPVLQNVIEKKNVEIHHKPVVQEIHEQKIIEIEKQPVVQNVVQPTLTQQARAETRFEEIGTGALGEQERLRLEQLRIQGAPKITQTGATQQFTERETVAQVVKQEFVERHIQPVVTEVREQQVVQEVLHPVVRKIHEAPIIREVTSAPAVINQTYLTHGMTEQIWQTLSEQDRTNWHSYNEQQRLGFLQRRQTTGFGQNYLTHGMTEQIWHGLNEQDRTNWHGYNENQRVGFLQRLGFGKKRDHLTHGMTEQRWQSLNEQDRTNWHGFNDQERQRWIGQSTVQTTTTGTGLSGATTTTTSGTNPLSNVGLHEQKLLHKEAPLTGSERQNLAVHEKVVDQVTRGGAPLTTGTHTTGVTHGATTVEEENKPGFMTRLKEKLHLGGHHDDTTGTHKH